MQLGVAFLEGVWPLMALGGWALNRGTRSAVAAEAQVVLILKLPKEQILQVSSSI